MDDTALFSAVAKGGNINTPSSGQDVVPTIISVKSFISITLELSRYQPKQTSLSRVLEFRWSEKKSKRAVDVINV